ncbi:Patatin [hydrothermal vent metagenome]|uniref:Patatin n=1 Tax=hydrothermal vent metagenome TaxID=652676 RepID=A0A3B0TTU9_9ZZZZ
MSNSTEPKIGIALGGGAARGLTHIPFIEAMDDLGIRPARIAGTSIGALLGAGWAAGLCGKEIREYSYEYLGSKRSMIARIWKTRIKNPSSVFRKTMTMQLDACEVINSFIPKEVPSQFSELKIPLFTVATDFRTWQQVVFRDGELIPAIAASIAIPSVFKPVEFGGRLLIDGSVSNPLPLDVAGRNMDILVAVDVNGSPTGHEDEEEPSLIEVGLGSAQILMHGLISNKLVAFPPDVYTRPQLEPFRSLEFWRVKEIVETGEKDKEFFKRQLDKAIENFISGKQKTR